MEDAINAVARDGGGGGGGADIGIDDAGIVEEELPPPVVGDPQHGIWLGGGDEGSGGDMPEVVEEQTGRDGVAEQEADDVAVRHDFRPRQCPIVGHQQRDVSLEEVGRGHVDEHDKGKVVRLLHLSHGCRHVSVSRWTMVFSSRRRRRRQ